VSARLPGEGSRLVIASLLVACAAIAAPAEAGPTTEAIATARALYQEGDAALSRGDLGVAREKLIAAFALTPAPIIGAALAHTQEKLGQLIEARETCFAVARSAVLPEETSRSAEARRDADTLAAALEARIPRVRVVLEGLTPDRGVTVTFDGASVPPAALGAPRQVNPGTHTIVLNAKDAAPLTTSITVAEGESRSLAVAVPGMRSVPPPMTAPPPQWPEPEWARPLAYGGLVVGGVGVVVGSITGALALSKASAVKAGCPTMICSMDLAGDITVSTALGNVSTATFIIGGAGAAVAIVGFVALGSSKRHAAARTITPWIGPTGGGLAGRF
jgi:hypothetical protein